MEDRGAVLIADSGSTKTDWQLWASGKKKKSIKTQGINPMLQKEEDIATMLSHEIKWDKTKNKIEAIHYYGAGVSSVAQQKKIKALLKAHFSTHACTVESDMLGAARSLCGKEAGVVCILGTGSNSCFYDGKGIKLKMPSLGYIAGDEGSGNHMGKKILRYYLYNTFDKELMLAFEQRFGNDKSLLIQQLYNTPYPNRYLASFVSLLTDFRGYYMVENIIEDALTEFFQHQLLKYRQSWNMPVHFIGSVAYEFRDVLKAMCAQYEIELGQIAKSPMEGLVRYHNVAQH